MLYNLSIVESMGSTDAAFINKLIYIFIDSILTELDQMNEAFFNKDYNKVTAIAHSMKSNIDLFCVSSLQKTIRLLEDKQALSILSDNKIAIYINEINLGIQNVVTEMKIDYPLYSN